MTVVKTILIILQLIVFSSFTWAAISFFKLKKTGQKDWKIFFIKYAGIFFIIWNLFLAILEFPVMSLGVLFGYVFFLSALIIFWSAIHANRKNRLEFAFSGINSSQIVKSGIYSIVRHPFYLSYSLAWLGGPIALQRWELIIPFILMGSVYLNAAREEEKYFLNSSLKEEYQIYQKHTGMFFPKIFQRSA